VVAAALAAVYVPLVTVGTAMMSEGLSTLVSLAALVAALQHRQSAHRWRWALLAGLLCGLAVLTRPNAAVLLLPLGLAVWGRPRRSLAGLGPPVALVAAAVLTVAPWTIRNAVVLDTFVPVTTQLGSALAGTYNDVSRRDGDNPWSWRSIDHVPAYEDLAQRVSKIPEAELERRVRERALDYIRERPVSVAEVGFWNTIRMLELAGFARARETAATISIPSGPAIAGVLCFWLYALLAIGGAFTARARATPLHVWLVPLLFAASVVFLTLETPRYRTPVDPFVVLLAALAVTAAVERRTRRAGEARSTS
jgi:4-amino-4-deoxy-L-arabinose transferase-like glycosyltransferase